jgi:hypothetical protein
MARGLPGTAALERDHRVAVGRVFELLEDGHKREDDRRDAGLAVGGIEVGERSVVELLVQHIADEAVGAGGVEQVGADAPSLLRHRARRLRFEANGAPHK